MFCLSQENAVNVTPLFPKLRKCSKRHVFVAQAQTNTVNVTFVLLKLRKCCKRIVAKLRKHSKRIDFFLSSENAVNVTVVFA